jgi:hypothetical protein
LLEKLPTPAPSVVLLSAIVGVVPVLQQTPRLVTVELPSSVMLPPLTAEVPVIAVTEVVVTTGTVSFLHPLRIVTTVIKIITR